MNTILNLYVKSLYKIQMPLLPVAFFIGGCVPIGLSHDTSVERAVVCGALGVLISFIASLVLAIFDTKKVISRMKEVGEILDSIEEHTKRLDYIALSTAVEASRAGEFGKGVMIAAEAVKEESGKMQQIRDTLKKAML